MSPVQTAAVRTALSLVKSPEGVVLRQALLDNAVHLRKHLERDGFATMGQPSAIVPVHLGHDAQARTFWRALSDAGVSTNLVEYPGVAVNRARIRLQVQATHRPEHAEWLVSRMTRARGDAARLIAAE